MTSKILGDNPDVAQQESGEEEVTEQSLINSLAGNLSALTESEEPKEDAEESEAEEVSTESTEPEEEVGDETETEEEEETEEETEETEEEDVLSQIDVDALSKEEKIELAKLIGSELGPELGKLRSENRGKDEKIAKLEKELSESISKVLPKDNQFSDITDAEELDKKAKAIDSEITAAINFLQGDEEYVQVGNEDWDRKRVAQYLTAQQVARDDIPKQRERLKELSSLGDLANKEMETAKSELAWLADEESEAYKSFKSLKDDSDLDLVKRISPKLAAKMERILAHAANSMNGETPKKKIKLTRKAKPVSGKLGSAPNGKPTSKSNRRVEEARKRILSGEATEDDIIAAAFK